MMYELGWLNWARVIVWLVIRLSNSFTYDRHNSRIQQRSRETARVC
jgi:basic amino acid/polyamine antiporter, APA family